MADDVVINIRTRGGRQAARDAQLAASGIRRIGSSASVASRGVQNFRRNTDLGVRSLYALRRAGTAAGLAIGGLGAYAVKTGIQFNASMEQNQVAFAGLLGSTAAAKRELSLLYQVAAKTPFEIGNITQATRQLLAYGFSAKQANSYLGTIGDAIAGSGGGAEQIDSLVRAIGQIRGKGKLQAEELQQIGELGILNRGAFAKNLGITTAELADAGNQGIGATKALAALKKTLDDTFGGASAKQAKTFNGQLSTLHDNINMTLGTITKPAFLSLEKTWLPALGATTTRINQIFSDPKFAHLDMAQKIELSKTAAEHRLGPLVDAAQATIAEMHLGPKLEHAFETGLSHLADAAAREGPHIAKAMVNAWMKSGPWGKLLSAVWVGKKIAGGALGLGGLSGVRGTSIGAGTLLNPVAVVVEGGGAPDITPITKPKGRSWIGKAAKGVGIATGAAVIYEEIATMKRWMENPGGAHSGMVRPSAGHHVVPSGDGRFISIPNGFGWDKDKGLVRTRAALSPHGRVTHHTTIVQVDKRVLGKAHSEFREDMRARK